MSKLILFAIFPGALLLANVEEKETIRQTYGFASKLEIRNVNGAVRVTSGSGNTIQFVANKRIDAKTPEALEQAKREVRLDVQASSDRLRVCIAGPFNNCNEERGHNCQGDCHRDYNVSYDFELQVPKGIVLDLRSVNGGISAKSLDGAFQVNTVNGAVTLEDMGSSGSAHTVNGKVKLSFTKVPNQPLDVKTVNGAIEAAFPKDFHADLKFKTLHGDVFTSFPSTAIGNMPAETERKNGRTVIRSNRQFGVRIAGGGPEHKFETVNGSIQIAER